MAEITPIRTGTELISAANLSRLRRCRLPCLRGCQLHRRDGDFRRRRSGSDLKPTECVGALDKLILTVRESTNKSIQPIVTWNDAKSPSHSSRKLVTGSRLLVSDRQRSAAGLLTSFATVSFLNIRVADIQACYELWKSRGPSSSQSQCRKA
jgi:hypothetical protein